MQFTKDTVSQKLTYFIFSQILPLFTYLTWVVKSQCDLVRIDFVRLTG